MAESSTVRSKVCFLCWEDGHMKNECQWLNYPYGVCGKAPMRLFHCRQGNNKGRGFLKCTTQPTCDAFEWLDELKQKLVVKGEDAVEDKGEDKVKLIVDGKKKLIFEGNVDDLCNIVKKLGLN